MENCFTSLRQSDAGVSEFTSERIHRASAPVYHETTGRLSNILQNTPHPFLAARRIELTNAITVRRSVDWHISLLPVGNVAESYPTDGDIVGHRLHGKLATQRLVADNETSRLLPY